MVDSFRLAVLLAFQAPAICLILCLYVFFSLQRNGLTNRQFFLLRYLAIGCLIFMLLELICGLVLYEVLPWSMRLLPHLYNADSFFMMFNTIIISELSISTLQNPPKRELSIIRGMYYALGFIVVARIAFFKTQLFAYTDASGSIQFGPLDDLQTWVCIAVMAVVTVVLFAKYMNRNEYLYRERYGKMLFSAAAVTVVMLVYVLTYMPYIIWMVYMFVVIYLHQSFQGMMIYTDDLTSLSNRRRMLKDMAEKVKLKARWSYVLADVNRFKQINDKYGHNEGDRALALVAEALRETAGVYNAEAYRIGGDELAVILPVGNPGSAETFCEEFRKCLSGKTAKEQLPYPLTVSCGYALYGEDSLCEIPDLMEKADLRMYENKKNLKETEAIPET